MTGVQLCVMKDQTVCQTADELFFVCPVMYFVCPDQVMTGQVNMAVSLCDTQASLL